MNSVKTIWYQKETMISIYTGHKHTHSGCPKNKKKEPEWRRDRIAASRQHCPTVQMNMHTM
jgi:hypothetical protein